MIYFVVVVTALALALISAGIWYRPPQSPEEAPMAPMPEERRRRIRAAHETGHCLVAWFSPHIKRVTSITIIPETIPEGIRGGYVDIRYMSDIGPDGIWDIIVTDLAGMAGELDRFGRFRTGNAKPDIIHALETAREFLKNVSYPDIRKKFPARDGENPDFAQYLPDEESPRLIKILNFAFIDAKKRIRERRATFDRLEGALLDKDRLDEAELKALLGERFWVIA